jgi:CheY-like chemotaxis protein
MTKILLLRIAHDLSAKLATELSRAGYDVATPESADVRTVLQHQPDLILLQTDVRTLDCCGLLTELKGNETTAVKVILLADGGPLERSHALDLGADDVLSIPFELVELFARIRAQVREKAPDDRLRLEALDARRKELEAEAALATIVAQKETGKKRWIVLGVVTALAAIGVAIVVRNAQLSRKSTATLTGVDGILASIDEPTLKRIAQVAGNNTEDLVQELARRKLIRPLVTQGHLGVVGPDRLAYDAQTTSGGSGGPLFNASGKVIGVNFATLSGFAGSNFAVPISHAAEMLEGTKPAGATIIC